MPSTTAAQIPIPQSSPLSSLQLQRLSQAIRGLSTDQISWAGGYLSGIGMGRLSLAQNQQPAGLTLLYASQTGNAQLVAETLARSAHTRGLNPLVRSMAEFKPRQLLKERLLLLVLSTQGEGEPPESALELYRYIHAERAPRLDALQFAVFGLGDSSYTHFCKASKDFDQRLHALGAKRLLPRIDADLDFQLDSEHWIPSALEEVEKISPSAETNVVPLVESRFAVRHDRNNPFSAALLENRRLTTDDAPADVRHISLQVDPDRLQYNPGDSLGVWFRNDPVLIKEILLKTGLHGDVPIKLGAEELPLEEALSRRLELTQLHPSVVARWAALSKSEILLRLLADQKTVRDFTRKRQVIDLLMEYPVDLDEITFSGLLQPLRPRLYSIASSQAEYPDEAHLTVSVLHDKVQGHDRFGGASGYLAGRVAEGEKLDTYVVENPSFRLPDDGDRPIVMIGAGTGIAPYRGFLQHRAAQGDRGRNWLLFGNRHFQGDFLYQLDWLAYRKSGLLNRIDLAFSRDHHPAYVQDRLFEQGAELFRWLEEGSNLYVCGGITMESSVYGSLQDIVRTHGGLTQDAAVEYVNDLRASGRYMRDVY